ncbi:MAG: alpha-2-macroglobulin [Burkholderiales bacterium]|nr:alpha-2-macroglobulin [Burkholderiales bacterium]
MAGRMWALVAILSIGLPVAAATVERFSPQGEVRSVRQAAARFSEDMVRFGDPNAAAPFAIECSEPGQGRWIDARNWVFDFARDLPPATRCTFRVKPATRSLSGGALTGKVEFGFATGGPAVLSSQPYAGAGAIDEEQVFILRLNGAAHTPSVAANAWCVVEGIGDRVPVTVLPEQERAALFKALKRERDVPDPRLVPLKCTQRLPAGANLTLVWGRGIASAAADPAARVATSIDQALKFKVRPEFKVSFTCPRENASAPCSPTQEMSLEFSAAVTRTLADAIRIKGPDGERKPAWGRESADTVVRQVRFAPPFAEKAEFSVLLPAKFVDDSGRTAVNAASFPLKVKTGEGTPLAKFAANFGIIERSQPVLPVTVRNVEPALKTASVSMRASDSAPPAANGAPLNRIRVTEDTQILQWLTRLRAAGNDEFKSRTSSLLKGVLGARSATLPLPSGGKAFEVIGIPLPEPGFHIVEIESERLGAALLGKPAPMYVRAGALVTNLAVHFKMARGEAGGGAVWVTTLDSARPVAEAAIRVSDCAGAALWTGKTGPDGVAAIRTSLARPARCAEGAPEFLVTARKGDELSFALSDWQNGIEPWRFNVNQGGGESAALAAHTVFDRPLLRAGETVSMKHFVREETIGGLALPGAKNMPTSVRISHLGSGADVDLPISFGARASASNSWKVPTDAKLGEYAVSLVYGGGGANDGRILQTGSFRVAEFRLPLMQGSVASPKGPQVRSGELPLDLALSYLSGGPAAGHAVSLTTLLRQREVRFADYEEFTFGTPADAAGETPSADAQGEARGNTDRLINDKTAVTLSREGTARFVVRDLPRIDRPRELVAEATYRDPNGEEQTLRSVTTLWPAAVVTGIHSEDWVQARRKARLKVVVLGLDGKPRKGAKVTVKGTLRTTLSSRTRTVGGFYSYDNKVETRDLGSLCSGSSDARGLLLCEPVLERVGNIELKAEAEDGEGRVSVAATSIWVAGSDAWFGGDNADRMDLLPEKRRYQPGETAKFQVRMPFRSATAWVAVEREGVVETLVVPLSGRDPVIALPIKPGYAPNVYVSVLAVRARVRDVPWYSLFQWGWRSPVEWWNERGDWVDLYNRGRATAMVDLAKPAFKLGLAEIQVGSSAFELKVGVAADKPVYQTRETARVKVTVKTADGKVAPVGTEVAIAAVDEALLELMPNASWNVLEAMIRRRGYFVETATAQMQVVGRRHFGKKAVAPGGGGGRAPTRELFDTLLLWKSAIAVDANGEALVDVPLNDALTSFRIVAIADAPAATVGTLFGSGSTSVRATKDLQILAGLPPLVREGDSFRAGVTLRNTTAQAMQVTLSAHLDGIATPPREATLAAGAAQEFFWPIEVPVGRQALAWTIEATQKGGARPAKDGLKVSQRVVPAVPLTVEQATLAQLDRTLNLNVAPPAQGLPERGGVRVALQPRLSGSQDGVRRYFEAYPFACLEQRTSKAIGLRDRVLWEQVAAALPNYLDGDGLAAYFPGGRGSDTLTAYLLAVAHESGFALPDNARNRMEGALIAFVEGRIQRDFWAPTRDLDARKLAAVEALSRSAKATPKLTESIALTPNVWPTHAVIDWLSILGRVPAIPRRDERLAEAEQVLRARLSMQGTRMVFSTEREDHWWWLMVGGDVNAARLIAAVAERPQWQDDLPRLVTGLLARQQKGAWQTTTANLWGSLALDKFAARFETQKVGGSTRLSLGEAARDAKNLPWAAQPQGGALEWPWPKGNASAVLALNHDGAGKPWILVQSLAAVPVRESFAAGYRVVKSVTPIQQKTAGSYTRGDILRVRLEVDASADMTWVVVADPIPAGATILGGGLARDSSVAQQGERRSGQAWPAFEERSFEAFRAYYEFAPKGKWSVEYTLRLNQDGEFALPATRVEAMYAPEMFGVAPNARMKVLP